MRPQSSTADSIPGLIVFVAGPSLLRTLLPAEIWVPPAYEVSRGRRPFYLTGPTDWRSPEPECMDSVTPQKRMYGPFWEWAHFVISKDAQDLIPPEIDAEWKKQGEHRTVAGLARAAAKVQGTGESRFLAFFLPYHRRDKAGDSVKVLLTQDLFNDVWQRFSSRRLAVNNALQSAVEIRDALIYGMRDRLFDHMKYGGSESATITMTWKDLSECIVHNLLKDVTDRGIPRRPVRSKSYPRGIRHWLQIVKPDRKQLMYMKYGDVMARQPLVMSEFQWLWMNRITHIPCYSRRLFGPPDSDVMTGFMWARWKADFLRDDMWGDTGFEPPENYGLVVAFFQDAANRLLPQLLEIDEIVDELIKQRIEPTMADEVLPLTRSVIHYLLTEWRPTQHGLEPWVPHSPEACVGSFAGTPVCGLHPPPVVAKKTRPVSYDNYMRRMPYLNHIYLRKRLAKRAKTMMLRSGDVPDDISQAGVPFAIPRTDNESIRTLPLGALQWAYDLLKYDFLHMLPNYFLQKADKVPSVVELAKFTYHRMWSSDPSSYLSYFSWELYGQGMKGVGIQSWSEYQPHLDATERRVLRLPTRQEIEEHPVTRNPSTVDTLSGDLWKTAPQHQNGVTQAQFYAAVYRAICGEYKKCAPDQF